MNLLVDLKMVLLNFNFVIIYTINKKLVLLKNYVNYLKDSIFECIFKEYKRLSFIFYFLLLLLLLFSHDIMMESLSLQEENIIKYIRNLFRLKKELNYSAITDIRNSFRLEKESKGIKDRLLRDIKNLFEHEEEEENYYKLVRVSNFESNNYMNTKVMVIEIKHYQLKNILTKLDHIQKTS